MGKRILVVAAMAALCSATAMADNFSLEQANYSALIRMQTLTSKALLNWKVGDSEDMKVTLEGMGIEGTMHKEATKEEGTGVWLSSALDLMVMKDTQEMLLDRNSGKVLKFIHNGKEEAVPDQKVTIIKTENTSITVPAGTFKCMHIVAKTDQVPTIEIWENPRDVSLDGSLKEYMDQGQVKITMELTSFKRSR